jgi:hypothetical protein
VGWRDGNRDTSGVSVWGTGNIRSGSGLSVLATTRRRVDHGPMISRCVRAVTAFTVAVVVLTSCGTGGDDAATNGADVTVDDAANPTTPSGEGAGGGPPPDGPATTGSDTGDDTADDTDLPGGEPVEVTGTLSGVTASPDESLWLCHLLRTDQGTFALEFTARQYEVVANVVPAQLEIRDADTGDPVAALGDDVAVEGIRHPDPVPVGGRSYACEGVTAYLRVSHIETVG